jgi:hypothetical protein
MSNLSKTIPLNYSVGITLNAHPPVANTGVSFDAVNDVTFSNPICTWTKLSATNGKIRANAIGTTTATVKSKNASGVEYTDTIAITIPNPVPDATDSGLEIGEPFFA